jgi:ubiquinone biosynthesis protein Coq4
MTLPFFSIRSKILELLYKISVTFYQKTFKRHATKWHVTKYELNNYEPKTLGKELFNFLDKNNFNLQDKLESHDVYHVITNTGVTVPEEISMQFLLLANGKRSIYGIVTALLGLIIIPEHTRVYIKAYKVGKTLGPLYNIDFEKHLLQPLAEIRLSIYRMKI